MKRLGFSKKSNLYDHSIQTKLSFSLEHNLSLLKNTFAGCDDCIFHAVNFDNMNGCLIYLTEMVSDHVLLEIERGFSGYIGTPGVKSSDAIKLFIRNRFSLSNNNEVRSLESIIDHILTGNTVDVT